jgi:hypothetical protein
MEPADGFLRLAPPECCYTSERSSGLIIYSVFRVHTVGVISGVNHDRVSRRIHCRGFRPDFASRPEIATGLLHVPVAVALVMAWICGVVPLNSQPTSAAPPGDPAKNTWPTLESLPDRTKGEDHVLLAMEPLTANACDVEKPTIASSTRVTCPASSLDRSETSVMREGLKTVLNELQPPLELPCVAETYAPELRNATRIALPVESSAARASCATLSGPINGPESIQALVPAFCREA